MKQIAVTIICEVYDEEELFQAALAYAVDPDRGACDEKSALEMLKPDGEIDPGSCLQMLLDPGQSPPGTSIQESSAETVWEAPDEVEDRCEHGMFYSGAGACPQCGGGAEPYHRQFFSDSL